MTDQIKRIESRENPTFKAIAALRQPRGVQKAGQVFLEGIRLCADALKSGIVADYLLFSDSAAGLPAVNELRALAGEQTPNLVLPDGLLNKLCDTKNPQGVALVCRPPAFGKPEARPSDGGLYLIAENIQDPGNLGTMIRTADAFAFDAVILTEGTVFPYGDKVLRAAMGSCFHVPLLRMQDILEVRDWLMTASCPPAILAADPSASDGLPASLRFPAALVVGNEARGLSDEARALCTDRISITMPGRAESLNAAAASAILCHDMMLIRNARNN